MKEKEGRTITLNDKGMLLTGIVILTLTFALGFMTCSKRQEEKTTIFTREELDRIITLQTIEDEAKTGAQVYAYKDGRGNLMIGYDFDK